MKRHISLVIASLLASQVAASAADQIKIGMGQFWGPLVGAVTLTALNQQITSYTEFWPMVLGLILIVLLYAFPAGVLGTLVDLVGRRRGQTDA